MDPSQPLSPVFLDFWPSFFADPLVSGALKIQAVLGGHVPRCHLDGSGPSVLSALLVGQANHWAEEEQERLRSAGLGPRKAEDPLKWRQRYTDDIRQAQEGEVWEVVDALLSAGAPVWGETLAPLELAFRLDLPRCFRQMLNSASAPTPSMLEKLESTADGMDWLSYAASHRCTDYLKALLAHGMVPTVSAASHASSLKAWRLLVGAGLKADPVQEAQIGLTWASASRLRPAVDEPWLEDWLSASAWALRASPRHWGSVNVARTHRQAIGLARRFGSQAWATHAWNLPSGRWRGRWSLPAAYALHSLKDEPPVAGIAGLACWLAQARPDWSTLSSVAGLPDRGWWALACWKELANTSQDGEGAKQKVLGWALRSLGVKSWDDEGLVADALAVTRWVAGTRRARHSALMGAWEHWALTLSSGVGPGLEWVSLGWVEAVEALADPRLGLSSPFLLKELTKRVSRSADPSSAAPPHLVVHDELVRMAWAIVALADQACVRPSASGVADDVGQWVDWCWPQGTSHPSSSPLAVAHRVVGALERGGYSRAPMAQAAWLERHLGAQLEKASGSALAPSGSAAPSPPSRARL